MDYVNQLFNGIIQYVLTGAFAAICAFAGIKLRILKNKKAAAEQ